MKNIITLIFTISLIWSQSANEIIKKAEKLVKGTSSVATFKMTVATPDFKRTMEMDSWWEGNKNALIVIKSPRREKGNKTLKIGNEMWSYLRRTETTIKIPPSMMLQSWNGSDFTNDDLVRESNLAKDYVQKLIGKEKFRNTNCWKIELTPKPEAPVVWGKLIYWVRIKGYIPMQVDYYNEKNELVRSLIYSNIKNFDGRNIPAKMKMINHKKKNHSTIIEYLKLKFNAKIPKRIFSFQELERGN